MLNSNSLIEFKRDHPALWNSVAVLAALLTMLLGFGATLGILSFSNSPLGLAVQNVMNWLLAANSVQAMWYVTRSAGFASYLLLWLSTALGLAIPTKLFDRLMPRAATFDFHQFISLLAIGFILLHVGVLMVDRYLPYTLAQILVPFISPYRPVWVGIGVFSFYLTLLVTITFYIRSRIGMKAFKTIHYFSLVSYLGVVIHSFVSGTDSSLPAVQIMYISTFLVVVFFTAYWIINGVRQSKRKSMPAPKPGQNALQLQRARK
jgi:methionine sulfoxide reductase heme-binding subunit